MNEPIVEVDENSTLPSTPKSDLGGPRSMLLAVAVSLAILAFSWLLAAALPEHNSGPSAQGVGGFYNLGLTVLNVVIWAAGIFGAMVSLILGADAWGQARLRRAAAARLATGDRAPREPGIEPSVLLGAGGFIIYYGVTSTEGVVQAILLLVALVVILFGLVRLVLNLLAPDAQV